MVRIRLLSLIQSRQTENNSSYDLLNQITSVIIIASEATQAHKSTCNDRTQNADLPLLLQ